MMVILANPRGFCAGVERAVDTVRRALVCFGAPIYVRHEIVHNRQVIEELTRLGAVFIEEISEIPIGSVLIFSAHGVSPQIEAEAASRGLHIINGTCPLVTKVHLEVAEHSHAGRTVFLIGHKDHVEVQGTLGHCRSTGQIHIIENESDAMSVQVTPDTPVAYVTQTTLSVNDTARIVERLRSRFPELRGPHTDDICYATQNRQQAVIELAQRCNVIVVIGAAHSSNSLRLREVAMAQGTPAHQVDRAAQLERSWFDGCLSIGVTSGASTPEPAVAEVMSTFRGWWPMLQESAIGEPETIHFRLPHGIVTKHGMPGSRHQPGLAESKTIRRWGTA